MQDYPVLGETDVDFIDSAQMIIKPHFGNKRFAISGEQLFNLTCLKFLVSDRDVRLIEASVNRHMTCIAK